MRVEVNRGGGRLEWSTRVLALSGALLASISQATAQDEGCQGRCLTFGFDQTFSSTDNLSLDTPAEGTTNQAITALDFGFFSETEIDVLSFNADAVLRAATGPDVAQNGLNLTDWGAELAYARQGANASFDASARLSENDLTFFDPLADLRDDGVPDDFETLGNSGTRRLQTAQVGLSWGNEGPFSVGLDAAFTDISYYDADPPEVDTQRSNIGLTLGFVFSPVLSGRLTVDQSYYDEVEDGAVSDQRQSTRIGAGFTLDRPAGGLDGLIYTNNTPDGTEVGFSVGGSYEQPLVTLSAQLGLTRGIEGDIYPSGELSLVRTLPNGVFDALLFQEITAGSDDLETLRSGLSLGLTQDLGALTTLNLDLNYVNSEQTNDDSTITEGNFGASVSHLMSEAWLVDFGYRYRMRDEGQQANSNEVFLGFRRDLERNY